jgi:protein-S-isoprenylcysteine O-methyltransferase Ste14
MAGAVELVPAGTPPSRALTVVTPARAAPSRWQRVRPPVLAFALTLAALALHALVLRGPVPWAQSTPLGLALAAAGFGWMAWAWSALRRAGTPLPSLAPPTVLVDEGPYRFGRNPIYLGMVVMMLGIGVAAGAPLMLVAAANFVAIVSSVHIVHEEANLKRAFGGWYSDYAASVRRWL